MTYTASGTEAFISRDRGGFGQLAPVMQTQQTDVGVFRSITEVTADPARSAAAFQYGPKLLASYFADVLRR